MAVVDDLHILVDLAELLDCAYVACVGDPLCAPDLVGGHRFDLDGGGSNGAAGEVCRAGGAVGLVQRVEDDSRVLRTAEADLEIMTDMGLGVLQRHQLGCTYLD